jgi:hypothetical protein
MNSLLNLIQLGIKLYTLLLQAFRRQSQRQFHQHFHKLFFLFLQAFQGFYPLVFADYFRPGGTLFGVFCFLFCCCFLLLFFFEFLDVGWSFAVVGRPEGFHVYFISVLVLVVVFVWELWHVF